MGGTGLGWAGAAAARLQGRSRCSGRFVACALPRCRALQSLHPCFPSCLPAKRVRGARDPHPLRPLRPAPLNQAPHARPPCAARWRARRGPPSSRSTPPSLWRCLWAWARPACATCSPRCAAAPRRGAARWPRAALCPDSCCARRQAPQLCGQAAAAPGKPCLPLSCALDLFVPRRRAPRRPPIRPSTPLCPRHPGHHPPCLPCLLCRRAPRRPPIRPSTPLCPRHPGHHPTLPPLPPLQARAQAPAIIFIDEIDSVGRIR